MGRTRRWITHSAVEAEARQTQTMRTLEHTDACGHRCSATGGRRQRASRCRSAGICIFLVVECRRRCCRHRGICSGSTFRPPSHAQRHSAGASMSSHPRLLARLDTILPAGDCASASILHPIAAHSLEVRSFGLKLTGITSTTHQHSKPRRCDITTAVVTGLCCPPLPSLLVAAAGAIDTTVPLCSAPLCYTCRAPANHPTHRRCRTHDQEQHPHDSTRHRRRGRSTTMRREVAQRRRRDSAELRERRQAPRMSRAALCSALLLSCGRAPHRR